MCWSITRFAAQELPADVSHPGLTSTALRLLFVSPRAGGGDWAFAGGQVGGSGLSDRERQELVLPVAGAAVAGDHAGGVAAHRADEGSDRRVDEARHWRGAARFDAGA